MRRCRWAAAVLLALCISARTAAALSPERVLVVYNSASTDARTVLDAYLIAHPDIPAVNVLDLNDTAIANRADVSYAEFVAHIRDPIRTYLDQPGDPAPQEIISFCLIRGLPHRIQDTDNPTVGDDPEGTAGEFNAGDVTCAAVDAELVLLWQNLDSGEAGGSMDSKADNLIDNPYHGSSSPIATFSRSAIQRTKTFSPASSAWKLGGAGLSRLTPGDMYLVSRIDAATTAAAVAMIARSGGLHVNRRSSWIILDEDDRSNPLDDDNYASLFGSDPDYENTRDLLTTAGFNVQYDNTTEFITSSVFTHPVIAYASYGENHSPAPAGTGTYIEGFQFAPGAIFNTIESYNGRALNGLGTLFGQEQVADFIAAGGTFGIGQVWEPFAFSLPDNQYLLDAMLVRGMSWAEAAWSAIPGLSWMQVVIGDPLAPVSEVVDQPADFDGDADIDLLDLRYLEACATGPALGPPAPECTQADLNGDGSIDQVDFGILQRCLSPTPELLRPDCNL